MSNDPQQTPQLAEHSALLREELKAWEKLFAVSNGRKAGRADIKRDRSIASKYKEYSKLRGQLSNKAISTSESGPSTEPGLPTPTKKRTAAPPSAHTSRRLLPPTPSRGIHPADLDPYDSPLSIRKLLFVNEPRTCIGPTPQKNGKVLGLFDLLEEDKTDSPLRTKRCALLDGSSNVQVTPRKGGANAEGCSVWKSGGSTPIARTPASSSKRRLYEAFNTPLKRRRLGDADGGDYISDMQFATPSFLRRDKQGANIFPTVGEDGEPAPVSPVIRMPAEPPVRGLSSMLARLRQAEDEALDDEMDILREMEMENSGQRAKSSSSITKSTPAALLEGARVAPSSGAENVTEAIGGGDDEADEKPELGRNGKPLKVWKKKGQKRTTKRVILRPVRMKPKSAPEPVVNESGAGGEEVQATSTANAASSRTSGKDVIDDDGEPLDVDDNDASAPTGNGSSRKNEIPKKRHDAKDSNANNNISQEGTKEGLARRAVKMISSQAHANFRRLKLRNKNSRGKGGGVRMASKRRR